MFDKTDDKTDVEQEVEKLKDDTESKPLDTHLVPDAEESDGNKKNESSEFDEEVCVTKAQEMVDENLPDLPSDCPNDSGNTTIKRE